MKITALVENTSSGEIEKEHGLSLYIETGKRKLMFDVGSSGGMFMRNAQRLGIDISDVDAVVISHGHADHGGDLGLFLQQNQKAKIYLQEKAFAYYYSMASEKYIGLDSSLAENERVIFTHTERHIDENLFLFSQIEGNKLCASSNQVLYVKTPEGLARDDFFHEQNLILFWDEKKVLLAGCAHRGIVNILETAEALCGKIDYVVAGFHLSNPATGAAEDPALIAQVAAELKKRDTVYYTGHCTGLRTFQLLKIEMGGQIHYLAAGETIELCH